MAKILVIEDEAILLEEMQEWLRLEGHHVFGASDGIMGIELARQHNVDLIICDIMMPRLDGFGVLLELNSDPKTVGIPFIFVTARAALDDMREGMNLGADDYITKPLTSRQLLTAIDTRLKKKTLQQRQYQQQLDNLQEMLEHEHHQRLLKAKIVAMFSHDFRNPLTAILSSLNLIQNYGNEIPSARKQHHFDKMERLVQRLMQMIEDMLVISEMEAQQTVYNPQVLDIAVFVQEVIDEYIHDYSDSHTINFTSSIDVKQLFDPKLFHQIVSNLLSNAIKYSPLGSEIQVNLYKTNENMVLEVQDEGIGVPPDDTSFLFEPFRRASNVKEQDGNGLGLAIVKQATDLHQGIVTVESVENEGSTFRVSIPCRDAKIVESKMY